MVIVHQSVISNIHIELQLGNLKAMSLYWYQLKHTFFLAFYLKGKANWTFLLIFIWTKFKCSKYHVCKGIKVSDYIIEKLWLFSVVAEQILKWSYFIVVYGESGYTYELYIPIKRISKKGEKNWVQSSPVIACMQPHLVMGQVSLLTIKFN